MHLEISFAEINTLLAAKGLSWLTLERDSESIIFSAKGARLRLDQADSSLTRTVFTHRGDNLLGKVISGTAGFAKLFTTLPEFLTFDTKHIAICWDKLLPQVSVYSSRVSVTGASLLVDLEI